MLEDSAANRVITHLDRLIDEGSPGDRLPSVRALMSELAVSPATVRAAVSQLSRAGRVEAITGSGTFIADRRRPVTALGDRSWQAIALAPNQFDIDFPGPLAGSYTGDTIDLASGYPDASLQPLALLKRSMNEAARHPDCFGRSPVEGTSTLRSFIAGQLHRDAHHDVLITSGGQSALSMAFRSLAQPGDTVLMESPTYIGAIAAARTARLQPSPVPIDAGGIILDRLDEAVVATGARLLYLQPRFHNPTGAHLAPDRRAPLLELAHRRGLIIIEDDWLFDLDDPHHARPPLAAEDPDGHVVYVRSLTKSIAPAVRIAAVASSGIIARRLRGVRGVEDFFVSPILQETALNVIAGPSWHRHLRQLRGSLESRRRVLLATLDTIDGWAPSVQGGPLHLWLSVPSGMSSDALRDAALREGVAIVSGTQWYPSDRPDHHVRLSVAAASTQQIVEGVTRLGRAIANADL